MQFRRIYPCAWAILLAFCLAVLWTAAGCGGDAPAASEQPTPKVTVTEVVSQETIDSDEYIGQTEASERVEVRARVFGYLKSIEFQDGDYVEQGKTLFTVEPDEYEAIHEQSLSRIDLNAANLEVAKSKHARNQKLLASNAVSREEYEESLAAMKSAEATITAARADANRTAIDLKYTVLKAPISGRVDRTYVSKGNLLTGGQGSGTLLTTIVSEQPMYVYFDVDERSLLRYMRQRSADRDNAPGSLRDQRVPCYLQLADEDDFLHAGELDFASAEVDRGTGTARIRGVFANQDRTLVSGLFVRVRIPVSEPYQALVVPERALASDLNQKYVYVVADDGTATRRAVELGGQRKDLRIIKSGLKAGERVIVKGLQRVKPGQKVDAEVAETLSAVTIVNRPGMESAGEAPASARPALSPTSATKANASSKER